MSRAKRRFTLEKITEDRRTTNYAIFDDGQKEEILSQWIMCKCIRKVSTGREYGGRFVFYLNYLNTIGVEYAEADNNIVKRFINYVIYGDRENSNMFFSEPQITYSNTIDVNKEYIVKSIDAALFYDNEIEMFTYSEIVSGEILKQAELRQAPVIIQELLKDKLDIRVTIIGNKLFPVAITEDGCNISGDWRKKDKDKLQYIPIELPNEVITKLKTMMDVLGLTFGGVDLALSNGKYYFIEINPTGEWGWLVYSAKIDIHKAIVNEMIGDNI